MNIPRTVSPPSTRWRKGLASPVNVRAGPLASAVALAVGRFAGGGRLCEGRRVARRKRLVCRFVDGIVEVRRLLGGQVRRLVVRRPLMRLVGALVGHAPILARDVRKWPWRGVWLV